MTSGDWNGTLAVVGSVIALIVIVGIVAKLIDLRRRREAEAVALQSRLSDALLTDAPLHAAPVIPTVSIPWTGSPITVEVSGDLPSAEVRDSVLRLIRRETAHLSSVEIEDKLLILPPIRVARAA